MMDIQQAIRHMNDTTGITLDIASKRAGLQRSYLTDRLTNKSGIRIDTFFKISKAFGFEMYLCNRSNRLHVVLNRYSCNDDNDIAVETIVSNIAEITTVSEVKISRAVGKPALWLTNAKGRRNLLMSDLVIAIADAAQVDLTLEYGTDRIVLTPVGTTNVGSETATTKTDMAQTERPQTSKESYLKPTIRPVNTTSFQSTLWTEPGFTSDPGDHHMVKSSIEPKQAMPLTEDQKRLQSYSKRLLDLTMRNNLLNYRDRKTGTLRIVEPELVDCYRYVVLAEHPMTFINSMPRILDEERSTHSKSRPSKYSLQTERTPAELVRCLRRLDTVARGSIEEQGIGILYLGLGLLHWIDSSGKEHEAPLVLAPVQLARASARSSFVLRSGDDDPIVNPTLAFFLDQVYGISIPEFDKDDRIDDYLLQVARLIAGRPSWNVTHDVVLSTFQFQKISMYHDLETRSSEILSHPIVRAVMGDGSTLKEPIQVSNPDDLLPTDTYQVVDADTSQQQAIIAAHKGASFVLQGPPGTGKSQTITNIIADSLAMGKKVLFVSEKKAALDVVHNRLKQVMLDDFCLVLHSNKLGKKEVLAQLDHTLKLYGTQTQVDPMANMRLNDLVRVRKHLNDYASEIYAAIQPLSMSPYDAIGRVTHLEQEGVSHVTCKMDFLETVNQEGIEKRREALHRYAQALGDVGLDPMQNPWVEFGIAELGYGEGYELLSRMRRVAQVTRDLVGIREDIQMKLGLSIRNNLYGMKDAADLLGLIAKMPVVPQSMLSMPPKTLLEMIDNDANADSDIKAIWECILDGSTKLQQLDSELHLSVDDSQPYNKEYVQSLKQALSDQIAGIDYCAIWSRIPHASVDSVVSQLRDEINAYEKVKNSVLEAYHPEVFDIDYIEMEARFKIDYQSFFKRMFGQRSADLRMLTACRNDGVTVDDEEASRILGLLHQMSNMARAMDERRDRYIAALGSCYAGVNTDFTQIELRLSAFDVATELVSACDSLLKECDTYSSWNDKISQTFTTLFEKDNPSWRLKAREALEKISDVNAYFARRHGVRPNGLYQLLSREDTTKVAMGFNERLSELLNDGKPDIDALNSRLGAGVVYERTLDELLSKSTAASATDDNAIRLSMLYTRSRNKCVELGLGPFLDALESNDNEVSYETLDTYPDIFSQTFYRAWLEQVAMRECPTLRYFSARTHEDDIDRFADLDRDQVDIDRDRVLAKLFANIPIPNGRARGRDEMSILMRELRKKARIRPIRKLFADIPNVLLALKPCLMMSPLSVSTYLESAAFKFDIVIFDEASQVRTEDALGVISRGKQVIIAGDSKQLPPTNFFAATVSEEGDEEDEDYYDQVGSFDSVLDEAVLLDSMSLTWHYRSRDESLIAFSNDEIYESELYTFPQSRISGKDCGVEYRYVPDGVYEGSRKGNAIEAMRVADLVLEHFATYDTERSLGVIALGESQSRVIEAELLRRRLEMPDIEKFFDQSLEEPFFVKNLENVQGDERDTIILSIGYGKNARGRFSHNFGPINMDGGERRLNVAVTRARINLKLVSSIDATQIDPSKVSNIGPRVLRDYLTYAKQGSFDDTDTIRREYGYVAHDSFADVVKKALEAHGFNVAEKVGKSGCKVDLAIRHPEHPDCYCVGLILDGDSYHTAETARDRDRLRNEVLQGMGWELVHVWSRSWLFDRERYEKVIVDKINRAIAEFDPPQDKVAAFTFERSMPNDEERFDKKAHEDAPAKETHVPAVVNEKTTHIQPLLYGFQSYAMYTPPAAGVISNDKVVKQLLLAQAPMSMDYYLDSYRKIFYPHRRAVDRTIMNEATAILTRKLRGYAYIKKEHGSQYIYLCNRRNLIARVIGDREVADISPTELGTGVLQVLRSYEGDLDQNGLTRETAAAFGFDPNGAEAKNAFKQVLSDLRIYGKIKVVDGVYFAID